MSPPRGRWSSTIRSAPWTTVAITSLLGSPSPPSRPWCSTIPVRGVGVGRRVPEELSGSLLYDPTRYESTGRQGCPPSQTSGIVKLRLNDSKSVGLMIQSQRPNAWHGPTWKVTRTCSPREGRFQTLCPACHGGRKETRDRAGDSVVPKGSLL